MLLLYSIYLLYFSFAPEYSADSLRYVFAEKQLLENFFYSLNEPLFNEETYENAEFHKNTDYSFPKEFLQLYKFNFLLFIYNFSRQFKIFNNSKSCFVFIFIFNL